MDSGKRFTLSWRVYVIVVGMLFSLIGDSAAALGLALDAAHSGTSWNVTEVYVAGLVPPILFAPLVGVLADRWRARRLWIVSVLAQAVALGAATAVPALHFRIAMLAVAGVFGVAAAAVGFKLLPELAGSEHLSRANSAVSVANSASGLLGPSLGATVHALWGSTTLLGYDALSFLVIAGAALIAVPASSDSRATVKAHPFRGAGAGFTALRASSVIGPMLPLLAGLMLATSIEGVAGVFYIRGVVNNDTWYGYVVACWALGSIPGAVLAGKKSLLHRQGQLVVIGAGMMSAGLLVAGLVPNGFVIAAAFVLAGLGNGAHNVAVRNSVHSTVPDAFHGQAWAAYSAMARVSVLAGYVLGTPGEVLTPRALVIASGALPLALTLGVSLLFWRRDAGRTPRADATGPRARQEKDSLPT
ncbi:MFS transporter [Streptomyces sp. NPDC004267]|uniref:MFS transporter n=1 Tax=Streptomyces sp. NPDC004267 TaxID=3364694 RepID=UPI0036A6270F